MNLDFDIDWGDVQRVRPAAIVAALLIEARTWRDIADQVAREHEDEHQGPLRFCDTSAACRMTWEARQGRRVGDGD